MAIYLGLTELSTGAGGGGGGFTKMNKYSTARALNDTTHKLGPNVNGQCRQNLSGGGQTSFQWRTTDANTSSIAETQNGLVGYTFDIGYGTQTVTANAGAGLALPQLLSFTPAVAGGVSYGATVNLVVPTSLTVNPATDLGLEDGASIGYFLVGGGAGAGTNNTIGGNGGYIIQGAAIITNASTDLVLTPGVASTTTGYGSASTISGGLTITTSDGNNNNGFGAGTNRDANVGVLGYGLGGRTYDAAYGGGANGGHGFGNGSQRNSVPGDGAILLFY